MISLFPHKASEHTSDPVRENRQKSAGQYMLAICILVTLIVVMVNLIVGKLPTGYTALDVSGDELYTLSDQSVSLVSALQDTVTIYFLTEKGQEDKKINQVLAKYPKASDNISIEIVDPVLSPSFTSKYTDEQLESNSLIVVSGDRSKVVKNASIYRTSYDNTTGSTSSVFDCEGQVTSAIRYVTTEALPKVYLLKGHGNNVPDDSFSTSLEKDGMTLVELNSVTQSTIPEDAGCIMIYEPQTDLTETELDQFSNYLLNGGNLILFTGASTNVLPNLEQLMNGYGMAMNPGVILEGNSNYCVPSYPNNLLPIIKSHSITDPLIDDKSLVLTANAHVIESVESRSTVTVAPLLTTSSESYLKHDGSTTYAEGDPTGPFTIGAAASEAAANGDTHIVWFASDSLLNAGYDEMVNGANFDLVLNSMSWMIGENNNISIRAKDLSTTTIQMTSFNTVKLTVIYVVLLPLLALLPGIYLCVKRNRSK